MRVKVIEVVEIVILAAAFVLAVDMIANSEQTTPKRETGKITEQQEAVDSFYQEDVAAITPAKGFHCWAAMKNGEPDMKHLQCEGPVAVHMKKDAGKLEVRRKKD